MAGACCIISKEKNGFDSGKIIIALPVKKKKRMRYLLLSLVIISFSVRAQVPSGYYNGTENLTGEELKNSLYQIIKGHTKFPYSSSSTDTWDILKESDRDPDNSSNVILFYTGWSVNASQEYNSGNGWNREHVWAKSRGDFGTSQGPGTDAHHLRPSDISVNAARDSRWFDYCQSPYFDGGLETGCFTSSTEYIWQPRAEVMGDVARIIFYMATRYEGENGEPDLEVIDYFPSDDYTKQPVHALLSTLLEWHDQDPVDDFERNRNDVIYSYQKNRNPFIDHPEFVDLIYKPSTSLNQKDIQETGFYPNPVNQYLYIHLKYPGAKKIFSATGKLVIQFEENKINLDHLEKGIYFLQIETKPDRFLVRRLIKQ